MRWRRDKPSLWTVCRTGPTDPEHADALERYYRATSWVDIDAMAATERAIEVLRGARAFQSRVVQR